MLSTRIFWLFKKDPSLQIACGALQRGLKEWAQCPEELGPPSLLGKNKIINSEKWGHGRKVSYKQKYFEDRGDTEVFQNRSADGAHEPGELTQGNMEIAWASYLTWSLLCAFDFVVQSEICVSQ